MNPGMIEQGFTVCALKRMMAVSVFFVSVIVLIICHALFIVVMVYTKCTVLCERLLENFFEVTYETKKSVALCLEILTEKSVHR